MENTTKIKKAGWYIILAGFFIISILTDIYDIEFFNKIFNEKPILIYVLVLIAIGGFLQFISYFFSNNPTIIKIHTINIIKDILLIISLISIVIAVLNIMFYIFEKQTLFKFLDISISGIIIIISIFFIRLSHLYYYSIELARFAFLNKGKIICELPELKIFGGKSDFDLKVKINDMEFFLKETLNGIEIFSNIENKLDFYIKPLSFVEKNFYKKATLEDYTIKSEKEEIRQIFKELMESNPSKFIFTKEKGFSYIKAENGKIISNFILETTLDFEEHKEIISELILQFSNFAFKLNEIYKNLSDSKI